MPSPPTTIIHPRTGPNAPQQQQKKNKKKRARPLPPHVNARNLAIEKRRRGELNEDFLNLARLIPSLAHARRLSKVLIVNESLRHLRAQRDMCIAAGRDMQRLLAENGRLSAEVEGHRAQRAAPAAPEPISAPATGPVRITEAMVQLMSVKDQVYGGFPAGFGDNWAYGHGDHRGYAGFNSGDNAGISISTSIRGSGGALEGQESGMPDGAGSLDSTSSSSPPECRDDIQHQHSAPNHATMPGPYSNLIEEGVVAPTTQTLFPDFTVPVSLDFSTDGYRGLPDDIDIDIDISDCLGSLDTGLADPLISDSAWIEEIGSNIGEDYSFSSTGMEPRSMSIPMSVPMNSDGGSRYRQIQSNEYTTYL
ncbi:hypothetical protein BJX70DRAFT_195456 [Aspergillus crustosus]